MISMKRLSLAVVMVCAFGAMAGAEVLTEYDAREDTSQEGLYLLFVSKPVSENSPAGDAFMTLGKGASPTEVDAEIHYGMIIQRGIPKLREITDEEAAAVRSAEGGQPTLVSAVRVDEAQYEQLKSWLTEWSKKEKFDIQEANALLDCTQEALSILDFKRPYRSGLMVPHVMNYYGDIQIINRKQAV